MCSVLSEYIIILMSKLYEHFVRKKSDFGEKLIVTVSDVGRTTMSDFSIRRSITGNFSISIVVNIDNVLGPKKLRS